MYKRTLLLIAIPAVVLLVGLSFSIAAAIGGEVKGAAVALTKKDNGGKFKVNSGSIIHIGLPENGSTGYAWYFDNLSMEYFEAVKDKAVTLPPDEKTVGAPMFATWILMAKKKGKSELKLRYYRIWEGPQATVDTFSVQIEIE
ncbi:MAG: protease inhibitor I42 family protein [Nitrospirae bacterium]|nr:protease inhibitor I42 family protein [Nitrospirota bacterium]